MSNFKLDDKTIVIMPSSKGSNKEKQTVTFYSVQDGFIVSITKEVSNDLVAEIKSIQALHEEIDFETKTNSIINAMDAMNTSENYSTGHATANWGIPVEQKGKDKQLEEKVQKVKNKFINQQNEERYQLPDDIKPIEFIEAIEEIIKELEIRKCEKNDELIKFITEKATKLYKIKVDHEKNVKELNEKSSSIKPTIWGSVSILAVVIAFLIKNAAYAEIIRTLCITIAIPAAVTSIATACQNTKNLKDKEGNLYSTYTTERQSLLDETSKKYEKNKDKYTLSDAESMEKYFRRWVSLNLKNKIIALKYLNDLLKNPEQSEEKEEQLSKYSTNPQGKNQTQPRYTISSTTYISGREKKPDTKGHARTKKYKTANK